MIMRKLICAVLLATAGLFVISCQHNSSGWPIIWGMHNGVPVQKTKEPAGCGTQDDAPQIQAAITANLVEGIKKRDGDKYIGIYSGMIVEKDGTNVMMFSATSGELLKSITAEEF